MYNKRQHPFLSRRSSNVCTLKLSVGSKFFIGAMSLCVGFTACDQVFAQRKAPTPNSVNATNTAPVVLQTPAQSSVPRFVDPKNALAMDLIKLFQEAAQNDPAFISAKNAYVAGKDCCVNFFSPMARLNSAIF
jgi:hypothetical protein